MEKDLYNVVYYFSLDEKKLPAISVTYFVYANSSCNAVQKVIRKIFDKYHDHVIFHIHSDVERVSNFLK